MIDDYAEQIDACRSTRRQEEALRPNPNYSALSHVSSDYPGFPRTLLKAPSSLADSSKLSTPTILHLHSDLVWFCAFPLLPICGLRFVGKRWWLRKYFEDRSCYLSNNGEPRNTCAIVCSAYFMVFKLSSISKTAVRSWPTRVYDPIIRWDGTPLVILDMEGVLIGKFQKDDRSQWSFYSKMLSFEIFRALYSSCTTMRVSLTQTTMFPSRKVRSSWHFWNFRFFLEVHLQLPFESQ